METLLQDVRYALRTLAKAPGFTAIAVLSLALGIGANTAIFSIVDALMLRNLPIREPERLAVFGEGRAGGFSDDIPESVQMISPPALKEIRKDKSVFEDASGVLSLPLTLHPFIGADTTQERMTTYLVTGNYFATLGVPASAGRLFSDAEDEPRNTHADVVISYAFWKRRWNKQPSAIGTPMHIGDRLFTVIGVAAPEFFGVTVGEAADAWIPYSMFPRFPHSLTFPAIWISSFTSLGVCNLV